MQSLKVQQTIRREQTPIARVSPRIIDTSTSDKETGITKDKSFHQSDDGWLSCEELETIEKRFTDLLQEAKPSKSALKVPDQEMRKKTKSFEQLDEDVKRTSLLKKVNNQSDFYTQKSSIESTIDDDRHQQSTLPSPLVSDNQINSRPQTPHRLQNSTALRPVLSTDDILKVESAYRSIGAQVFAARSSCDLYITTAERLSKLEDWILFQQGLPVWLFNSGTNPKRSSRLSLILAEFGSGFPIWQDTINSYSEIKLAREQHITFRLSDRVTLAVMRFYDILASKEFFSFYERLRSDSRHQHVFGTSSTNSSHQRSSSCGSILKSSRKALKNISKSSISNPCQFQHITSLQIQDRNHLISLDQCLLSSQNHLKRN